ncbi:MAG TPA: M28 family peptidase [Gaiellaceae bacterium]|nr:M28 family peptidase [Gaiellaceae bacterium]
MAAVQPRPAPRRPRRGSAERPVNAQVYRGTWLLVGLPLLVLLFSLARPAPLAAPTLPASFDRAVATDLAVQLARSYPDRSPGSPGATGAARWVADQLRPYGLTAARDSFDATIPGRGAVRLTNLVTTVPGTSPLAIVVTAHRDDAGLGSGAVDNASGTAALIELARLYGSTSTSGPTVRPSHTIVFVSSDAGSFGGIGAAHFATTWPFRDQVVAVINLDSIGGAGTPRIQIAGDTARSPAASLVATAVARIADEAHVQASRPSVFRQLVDLGFPFSLYEQAPFVARGIPAVTLTTAGDRPPDSFADRVGSLRPANLAALGRAAQDLLGSLDQGLELASGTTSYVFLGARIVRGWAIELVLVAMLLPFLAAAVDLFARCRRRRIAIMPAVLSYRSRLAFWLWLGLVFGFLVKVGVWPGGSPRPPAPETSAAGQWSLLGLGLLGAAGVAGWLVARERLLPRRQISASEALAGHTAALLALAVVALLVVATNPFALIFVLPSLHAWLWLPQLRESRAWLRLGVLAAGLLGPCFLLWSFGVRFGLGWDAPWYLSELYALGYAPFTALLITLAWAAAGAQLAALAVGRYAPYPSAGERPRLGPFRRLVRSAVLAVRGRRRATERRARALGG